MAAGNCAACLPPAPRSPRLAVEGAVCLPKVALSSSRRLKTRDEAAVRESGKGGDAQIDSHSASAWPLRCRRDLDRESHLPTLRVAPKYAGPDGDALGQRAV